MKNTSLPHSVTLVIIAILAALLLAACASGDDGIDDGVLRLTFDGESCIYEGPTTLKAGPVTLLFFNESETTAYAGVVKHTGDKTIQDMIDYTGEEPSSKHAPSWTQVIYAYVNVLAGESSTWEGVLESGIHTIVCIRILPHGAWFGTGLTVED